jgi:hypothetical protein
VDYIDYTNLPPNFSYGSSPDGQAFAREQFSSPTPGASNLSSVPPAPSYIDYGSDSSIYTQNFDSLPDPGSSSVNTGNPVTISNVTYSLANPFDFAYPVLSSGNGGLGLTTMAGWYGLDGILSRFGATDGDQTTGGQISFGLANSSNRALGLLATSSTGLDAFGAKFINTTGTTLNYITLQVTGEVWRQSNLPKTLEFYYFIDPTATAPMSLQVTALIPALNVNFPTVPSDSGGVAVNGTLAANQVNLAVTNYPITGWPQGTALWLVWEMADTTGKAQGLGIDNLSFSSTASTNPPVPTIVQTRLPTASGSQLYPGTNLNSPILGIQISSANQFVVSWPASPSDFQLYCATNLAPPIVWTLVTNQASNVNGTWSLTLPAVNSTEQFFRLSAPRPASNTRK